MDLRTGMNTEVEINMVVAVALSKLDRLVLRSAVQSEIRGL